MIDNVMREKDGYVSITGEYFAKYYCVIVVINGF